MPVWGYSKQHGFILRCPNCNYRTYPLHNKQAVIASWFTSNAIHRGNQKQVLDNWIRDYQDIKQAS